MSDVAVLPGAEPFSAPGGPHGALVLHGFTGSPQSMRGVAQALADAGFAVELPRLPGHGTSVEDMMTTSWGDWSSAAEAAYEKLAANCDRLVVVGLSMGGTLTAWLATRHPEIAGIVVINGFIEPAAPALQQILDMMVAQGVTEVPGIGSDIALPGAVEVSYGRTPISCTMSLMSEMGRLKDELAAITSPVLILNSPQDHVVAPVSSDTLAAGVSGPVERVTLERSYHVATLDYDRELIEQETVAFARRVTGG
ncbi:MAG: carboxylesterase [Acidimicrobiaceae bacterium]|jgi:carboxylesterase|nr:carboxylesterase [Acidimicrobiaceae bacterium]